MVKLVQTPAGVVEDAIEHHADPAGVSRVQQFAKRAISPQDRIHPVVVVGVIAVVGRRLEDGVEVDGRDPQCLQVIQPFRRSLRAKRSGKI
jgi:hypothetical protein